jgi:hypothetical protein
MTRTVPEHERLREEASVQRDRIQIDGVRRIVDEVLAWHRETRTRAFGEDYAGIGSQHCWWGSSVSFNRFYVVDGCPADSSRYV